MYSISAYNKCIQSKFGVHICDLSRTLGETEQLSRILCVTIHSIEWVSDAFCVWGGIG